MSETCFRKKLVRHNLIRLVMQQLFTPKRRLVYDGVCNLCVGAVRFLRVIDRRHEIDYAPYQTLELEERKVLGPGELQGRMQLIERNGFVLRGAAAIAELCKLFSPFVSFCDLFNTPLAEGLYDFIARRRYRLFGCRASCYLPPGQHLASRS